MATPGATDKRQYSILGSLLRAGLVLSAVVVFAGGLVYLTRHGAELPYWGVFRGEPEALRTLPGVVAGALIASGRGLIQFGLLLLVLTPVARVALSVAVFARQRDYTYVAITLVVLAILAYNLLGGLPGA